jgi:uncharacterized protein with PhoU and TrkA domain
MREQCDVLVIALQRPDDRMVFLPPPEARVTHGERLIVLGDRASLAERQALART